MLTKLERTTRWLDNPTLGHTMTAIALIFAVLHVITKDYTKATFWIATALIWRPTNPPITVCIHKTPTV